MLLKDRSATPMLNTRPHREKTSYKKHQSSVYFDFVVCNDHKVVFSSASKYGEHIFFWLFFFSCVPWTYQHKRICLFNEVNICMMNLANHLNYWHFVEANDRFSCWNCVECWLFWKKMNRLKQRWRKNTHTQPKEEEEDDEKNKTTTTNNEMMHSNSLELNTDHQYVYMNTCAVNVPSKNRREYVRMHVWVCLCVYGNNYSV